MKSHKRSPSTFLARTSLSFSSSTSSFRDALASGADRIRGRGGEDTIYGGKGILQTLPGQRPGLTIVGFILNCRKTPYFCCSGTTGGDKIKGNEDGDLIFGGLGKDSIGGGKNEVRALWHACDLLPSVYSMRRERERERIC